MYIYASKKNKEKSLPPHLMQCKTSESPPSSMDSCSGEPPPAALSTASSGYRPAIRRDLSTDLHLGLSLSCSSIQTDSSAPSTPRSALTTTATATAKTAVAYQRGSGGHGQRSLFVKVYMEGVPIGRKLDLLSLDGYDGLLAQLGRMFKASITHPDVMGGHQVVLGEKQLQQARHVLTYEDQEGDWMMVGDVPWELFLTSVKKLRIARADKCYIN